MKLFVMIFFLLSFFTVSSQNIFDYEKKINPNCNYIHTEINFKNLEDKINLSGTLIEPKAEYKKIIIIVPGTGKDTRHAHFVMSEKFLQNNIAVYRFDERGIGKSEGAFSTFASTLTDDLYYCITYLKDKFKSKKIGILGHSLGGIASIGAYEKNKNIDFLVQMATPVEKEGAFFKYQAKQNISSFYRIKGKSQDKVIDLLNLFYPIIIENDDFKTIRKKAKKVAKENGFNKGFYQFISPAHIDHVKQNHEQTYKNIKIPLLYIIGSNDKFVNPKTETALIKSFKNSNIQIKLIDGLNHYLTTGEYKSLYQIDDTAFNEILKFILINTCN